MKQTAVEWLIKELSEAPRNLPNSTFLYQHKTKSLAGIKLRELFKQALAMEKEQIVEAHMAATLEYVNPTLDVMKFSISSRSEEYYTETYQPKPI